MNLGLKIETVQYQDRTAAIKNIRIKVFQEEQGVSPNLEFDGLDTSATHLLAYLNREAVATARIRAIDADTVKIERLAVLPEHRNQGIARQLMQFALSLVTRQGKTLAIVHAQKYITPLYTSLGFKTVGKEFYEAGILHVKMIEQLSTVDPCQT